MNKLQFLAELKSNIHMLEDEEQGRAPKRDGFRVSSVA